MWSPHVLARVVVCFELIEPSRDHARRGFTQPVLPVLRAAPLRAKLPCTAQAGGFQNDRAALGRVTQVPVADGASMSAGGFTRWMYRGGRPNRLARILNRASAVVFARGVAPDYLVT